MLLKKLIRNKKPFAVMQYFVSPIFEKGNTKKIYEILVCNDDITHDGTKLVESYYFTENDKYNFNLNKHLFEKVHDDLTGKIYEYLEFKKRYNLGRYLKLNVKQNDENYNNF